MKAFPFVAAGFFILMALYLVACLQGCESPPTVKKPINAGYISLKQGYAVHFHESNRCIVIDESRVMQDSQDGQSYLLVTGSDTLVSMPQNL